MWKVYEKLLDCRGGLFMNLKVGAKETEHLCLIIMLSGFIKR